MRYLFFVLILTFLNLANAQKPVYSTKNKKAIEQFELGKQFLQFRKYYDAVLSFERATEFDKNFYEAYLALAGCHRTLRDEPKMKLNLLYAFSIKPSIPEAVYEYFALASVLMKEGDYKNAKYYVNQFLAFNPSDKRVLPFAERILKNCEFAEVAITKPLQFSPVQLPVPLNQFRNQYFPSLTADGQYLLYTVRQAMGSLEEENLYYSEKSEKGWSQPEQVSTRINTKENEGASSISGDGKTLVYTYCTPSNGCDLYITRKAGKEWLQPGSIGANVNTRGWESHPSLSADGRTLYFAAERAGGIGKEDIWITHLDSNDVWTSPVNAGPKINTPDSDFTPFIHPNGRTLYFASRGWAGMGGTDLFMVDKTNDSTWTEARNLGYPINTFSDELGFTVSSDFSVGYFSKDVRNYEGRYISTLYSFQVPESIKGEIKCIYLKGRVLDEKTNKPIKARIELVNLETGKTEQNILSDGQTGAYLLIVPNKQNYGLFVSSIGYLYQSLHFDSNQEEMLSKESFDILLKPIQKNSEAILRNVFFETKKYDLDSTSATELSKLAKLVRDNHLKIEVGGHTDNVGSPQDNLVLSQKRAQAVVAYLIKSGISKTVVSSKGYGETKPKADNTLDEGRKMNRRIEIKILE